MAIGLEFRGLGSWRPQVVATNAVTLIRPFDSSRVTRKGRCGAFLPSVMTEGTDEVIVRNDPKGTLLQTCGPGGIPCDSGAQQAAFSGLGTVGCSEFDVEVDRLGVALKVYETRGLDQNHPVYLSAKAFHKRESAFLTSMAIAWGESCRNAVNEAQALTSQLNDLIKRAGGEVVPGSSQNVTGQGAGDTLSTIKWIAIATAAVAVTIVIAPYAKAGGKWLLGKVK